MSTQDAERLARRWIEGWNAGTPEAIPLADGFVHTSPFGTIEGRDNYLATVKPMAATNVASLKIVRTLGSDRDAVIWFEMHTPNGVVQVSDWVRVDGNEIVAITSFYDPASLPHREGYDAGAGASELK